MKIEFEKRLVYPTNAYDTNISTHNLVSLLLIILSFAFNFQMAQLPEGITELLHHEKLSLPLVS